MTSKKSFKRSSTVLASRHKKAQESSGLAGKLLAFWKSQVIVDKRGKSKASNVDQSGKESVRDVLGFLGKRKTLL